MDAIEFVCPRCGTDTSDEFYGPCESCRQQLRLAVTGEHRDIEAADYVPKVNVTANAVALKDD